MSISTDNGALTISQNYVPSPNDTDTCVSAVEDILGYTFNNKKLLEDALTHPSCIDSVSYQRLEFVGDAVLGLAFANFVFLGYPDVDQGILSLLRAANISTEKLARVAVRHGLYRYVRHNALALDAKVREFALTVQAEDEIAAVYGGAVKAPKVLADIVESVVAAIYVDCDFNLKFLWQIIRSFLEPIVTLETLPLQPVTMLYELCQKQGKKVEFRQCRKVDKNICSIYMDGKLIATGMSDQKDIAKLNASKEALEKLNKSAINHKDIIYRVDDKNEIEAAKQKLHELCCKKKWPKPTYRVEKEVGLAHDKKFICSVEIETVDVKLWMLGDEKSRIKEAENSAASLMIHSLLKPIYM
ncbi:ribonuclease 3-like protein 2 isoform X2 [Amaranthus tricolor]|uniref:ribonuclease 3-like protein 2 isoform X2 n=1 Tax=Amaranthus tricolor TaxID=29722 RepID=UPI002586BAC6|nr:ribonuclease 3-like protein 2 isoform X2 [Amaranthus tricolor]